MIFKDLFIINECMKFWVLRGQNWSGEDRLKTTSSTTTSTRRSIPNKAYQEQYKKGIYINKDLGHFLGSAVFATCCVAKAIRGVRRGRDAAHRR